MRLQQIVVGGLVMGASTMLVAVAIIRPQMAAGQAAPAMAGVPLTYGLMGLAACLVLPRLVVPQIAARQARAQILSGKWQAARNGIAGIDMEALAREHGDRVRLWPARWNATILSAGLMEAPAILCFVAYLIEGHPAALIAGVFFMVLLALHAPRAAATERWLDQQVAQLGNERLLQGGSTDAR